MTRKPETLSMSQVLWDLAEARRAEQSAAQKLAEAQRMAAYHRTFGEDRTPLTKTEIDRDYACEAWHARKFK